MCVTNSSMRNERMNYSDPLTHQHLQCAHTCESGSGGVCGVCVCVRVRVFYFGICVHNSV